MTAKTPASLGFSMPAEWAPNTRTWISWPCREELWGDAGGLERARAAYAGVARAIAAFEPVTMVARPQDAAGAARACGKDIEVLALPIDDSWMRDNGPTFVARQGVAGPEIAGLDFKFNAWGGKYDGYAADDALPRHILEHLGVPRLARALVLEGGAINVDGEGTLLTTGECLLNPNRNPGMSRADIERELAESLGVTKVVWLPHGLDDDETDGHIDNAAMFAAPGRVLFHAPRDASDPNTARMAANRRALTSARDAAGRTFEIIDLPQPALELAWHGRRMPFSYVNFYMANDAIIAPSFGVPEDKEAARVFAATFPGREIVQVPARDIVVGGGGIHCITQQQPVGAPARLSGVVE